MSKVVLCLICLRTDVELREIHEDLVEFHDELCDYEIYQSRMVKYCAMCEHKLRKMYQFRKQCILANNIFKEWLKKKNHMPASNLHECLNPPTLCYSDSNTHQMYNFLYNTDNTEKQHILLFEKDNTTNLTKTLKTEVVEELEIEDVSQETDALVNSRDDFELQRDNFDLQRDNFDLQQDNFKLQRNNVEVKIDNFGLQKGSYEIQIENFRLQNMKQENVTQEENQSTSGYLDQENVDDLGSVDRKENLKYAVPTSSFLTLNPQSKIKTKSLKKVKTEKDESVKLVRKQNVSKISGNNPLTKKKNFIKEKILDLIDSGDINDVGDNIKITKEVFVKIFDKCDIYDFRKICIRPVADKEKLAVTLKKFIKYLMGKYNPEYDTVFDIEYLNTHEKKIQEFNRRKESRLYQEAPFKCELCYKGFLSLKHLNYHNRWHKPKPNDKMCNICPVRTSVARLKTHHKENHKAVFSCKKCPFISYRHTVMLEHYKQHKGVEYSCPTCLSVFNCKSTLNNHVRSVHAASHPCPSCARCFVSEKGLLLHRNLKHSDEPEPNPDEATQCSECDVTFDTHAIYLKHRQISHKRRRTVYKCNYCFVRFDTIDELREHKLNLNHQKAPRRSQVRTFTNIWRKVEPRSQPVQDQVLTCPVCHVVVPNTAKNSLYLHHKAEHPGVAYNVAYRGEKHLCEECGKAFKVYQYYVDHKNVHTGAKPYVCEKCPAKFGSARHLYFHNERHGTPRHQCNHCGKQFYSAANLFVHKRIHVGDRRFKCHICDKAFLHANAVTAHVNGVHYNIRRQKNPKTRNTIKHIDN